MFNNLFYNLYWLGIFFIVLLCVVDLLLVIGMVMVVMCEFL